MKKTLTLMLLFLFGMTLVFLFVQYNQRSMLQMAIQQTLEINLETVASKNLDSSYRVYKHGNTIVNVKKLEDDLKSSFMESATYNTDKYETTFTFKYLSKRNEQQTIEDGSTLKSDDIITAIQVDVNVDNKTYSSRVILDVTD
ncbi:hypothetical protein [Erysipelothrix anatis]|uniref:hypothetical protein n=1 Tax=Erysipelothrix anatis TaxID=2683713 RepID=UPI00140E7239|nr:hypothetical protein [Erysipelothrix anatis]